MLRTTLFWIHLIAGVTAGGVILMMSLTGAALAFEPQLLHLAERRLQVEAGTVAEPLGLERLLTRARAEGSAAFGDFSPATVIVRSEPGAPVRVDGAGSRKVYLDPYTGAVLSTGFPRLEGSLASIRGWHRWFNVTGGARRHARAFTGAANLILLALLLSGPILWIPRKRTWQQLRKVLWFRGGLRAKARDFNWHNVLGIWSVVPLFVIAASATVISYGWASDLVSRVAAEPRAPAPAARAGPPTSGENRPVDLDTVVLSAASSVPGWREITLSIPRPGGATAVVDVLRGSRGQPALTETLRLDPSTGAVLERTTFQDLPRPRRYRTALRFAHTGELWGLPGQTIAAVACLAAVGMVLTGLSLAIRRLSAFRGRRATSAPPPSRTPAPPPRTR